MVQREMSEHKITDPAEMLVLVQPPLTRHPGVYFREVVMPQYKLKVAPLAELLGVARPNLSNVLHGKVDVSRDLAYRLGALLGDAVADFLIAYQHRWDLERERDRREELKREIARLPLPVDG